MDFATTPDDEAFRAEVRAFLARHHPSDPPRDRDERRRWQKAWAATLADEGFAAPAWPRRWGGMELPVTQQLVWHEEMTLARVPAHPNPNHNIVGPTIILHGTDAQRERFLKPMLRADEVWCQGFSEPGAGSDLVSLQTRAVRDGDHYVVTGQKVWSTHAHHADWMFALVRTGDPGSRAGGITYLLVDMRSPGVTVRPLRDMTGDQGFSEIFLDEVRVPVDQRVGDEDGGWRIARTSLGHERSTAFVAQSIRYRRIVDELHDLARQTGAAGDPLVRQDLARVETGQRLVALHGMRALSKVLRDGEPGPEASVSRLFHTLFEQRLHEVAVSLLGPAGLLDRRDPHAVQRGRWTWGFLRTRASTIGAGTAEIQRNTLAEQVLGLPRDPGMPPPPPGRA